MGKTILIAEDEVNARKSLADVLIEKGHRVIEVDNGKDALKKAQEENPDIALLDTILPEMDGIELCRQIKKVEKMNVTVIVYTGKIDAIDARKARNAGADDYVVMTRDLSYLIGAIEKVI